MYLQGVDSMFDIVWTETADAVITYGNVFHQNEVEMSAYNFEFADVKLLFQNFDIYEHEAKRLVKEALPLAAYEMILKASHTFNLLDARHAISVTERQHYILRVRKLAHAVAKAYYQARERLGFPMLKNGALHE